MSHEFADEARMNYVSVMGDGASARDHSDHSGHSDHSYLGHDSPVDTSSTDSEHLEPLATDAPPAVLHFEESVVGLTLADVSVVLVENRAVVVPIPRSLARQCGFQVLQVDEEHLLAIGVVPVRAPEPIPPRPQLPTTQRGGLVGAGFRSASDAVPTQLAAVAGPTGGVTEVPKTIDPTNDAVYLGVAGPVSLAPRAASDVSGEVDGDQLANARQRMQSLAPAPLASPVSFEVLGGDVALAQQVSAKLAKRSADLAPASMPILVVEGVERLDHEASHRDDGTSFNSLHDPDLARPFAALPTQRADVGLVTEESFGLSWPEVERRISDRDSTTAYDRADVIAQMDPTMLPSSEGFFAVSAPTAELVAQQTHEGLLSPLAPSPTEAVAVEVYGASDSFMDDASISTPLVPDMFMVDEHEIDSSMAYPAGTVESDFMADPVVTNAVNGLEVSDVADNDVEPADEIGVPVWFARPDAPAPTLEVAEIREVTVDVNKPLPRELGFELPTQKLTGSIHSIEEDVAFPLRHELFTPEPTRTNDGRIASALLDETIPPGEDADRVEVSELPDVDQGGLIPERSGFADEIADCVPSAFEAMHVQRSVNESFAISIDTLRLDPGSIAVVLGREGSGKTQFARTVAGFVSIDSGSISSNGVELHSLAADERIIREAGSLGFANATPMLVEDLTVVELIELPLLIQELDPHEARSVVSETLQDIELAHLADRVGDSLSRSEVSRVALIRALISSSVVVLDDALVGLSGSTTDEMVSWVEEAAAGGSSVIVVTGDASVAARFAGSEVQRYSLVRGALLHEPPIAAER